ncbi:MAG: hypothetical protein RR359_04445 [Bacilli bacterium]
MEILVKISKRDYSYVSNCLSLVSDRKDMREDARDLLISQMCLSIFRKPNILEDGYEIKFESVSEIELAIDFLDSLDESYMEDVIKNSKSSIDLVCCINSLSNVLITLYEYLK